MTLLLSISREEKSYETSVNHLKVSFLSQNFMRGLGFAIMLFIPGIFASVSFLTRRHTLALLTPIRHFLAPNFSISLTAASFQRRVEYGFGL
jgi:hypothetical protein